MNPGFKSISQCATLDQRLQLGFILMFMIPQGLKQEIRPTLQLAIPLALAELAWMTMGIIDTIMVGRVSPEAIGGVSIGFTLFHTLSLLGVGLLLGMDTLVAQAFGAGQTDDCHRTLFHGVYLTLIIGPCLMVCLWICIPVLRSFGIHPDVLAHAIPYMKVIALCIVPLLLYSAFRCYLQGMNIVKPITFALVTANLINLAGNWILIFGNLGAPALGTAGAAWATSISLIYMFLVLLGYAWYHARRDQTGLLQAHRRLNLTLTRRLLSLGAPAALQIGLESGMFTVVTVLIGKLDPISLAAHQIVLVCVSFTYMFPLGVGAAAAVRVGQAVGRHDRRGAAQSGWAALFLGAVFMLCASAVFLLFPAYIARIYTVDASVIAAAISLLFIAAFFQLFDGVQTIATGALRGTGDTRTSMICYLIICWALGLPFGYFLSFVVGWGARGLWAGLCVSLVVLGSILLLIWAKRAVKDTEAPGYS